VPCEWSCGASNALAPEVREELRHPFTLRVYLDLYPPGALAPAQVTRAELMERWLSRAVFEAADEEPVEVQPRTLVARQRNEVPDRRGGPGDTRPRQAVSR
jgi:hypothetical protein